LAVARLYTSQQGDSQWSFEGLMGAVVVVFDTGAGAYFLRLVDLSVCFLYYLFAFVLILLCLKKSI
jgi:hypothetical protein